MNFLAIPLVQTRILKLHFVGLRGAGLELSGAFGAKCESVERVTGSGSTF